MSDYLNLEQLPNEIFEEIFEYLNIYELYKSFSKLNSRIDSLIGNFKHLQIILYSPEDIDHRIYRYFLPKIKVLIVNHSKNFYDPTKFILSSIRCLILCQPTREQWNSIKPSFFPHLERLYLINIKFTYRTEELCRLIFSNGFPYLQTCSLPHVSYEDNNQWTCSPCLQSLQIGIWDIRVYTQILNTCPNLNRLKIELSGGNNQEKLSLLHSNKKYLTLRHLAIYCSGLITSEFIDLILSCVPNLRSFVLHTNCRQPKHIPIDTLASIFECRTRKLNRIYIVITLLENSFHKEQIHTKYLLFQSCKIQHGLNQPTRLIIFGSL